MVQLNEIRVNNYYLDTEKKPFKWGLHEWANLIKGIITTEDIYPIALTKDVINKITGAEEYGNNEYKIILPNGIAIELYFSADGLELMESGLTPIYHRPIKHLHALQDVVFFLWESELAVGF